MGKRLPDFHTWQWCDHSDNQCRSTHLVLHFIAASLFVLAALLLLNGLFSANFSSLAIGVISLIAARGVQRHEHALE
jgi:uncharacterized membrane-anchored protein